MADVGYVNSIDSSSPHSGQQAKVFAGTGTTFLAVNAGQGFLGSQDDEVSIPLPNGNTSRKQAFAEYDTTGVAAEDIGSVTLTLHVTSAAAQNMTWRVAVAAFDWGGGTVTTVDWRNAAQIAALLAETSTSLSDPIVHNDTGDLVIALDPALVNPGGMTRLLLVPDNYLTQTHASQAALIFDSVVDADLAIIAPPVFVTPPAEQALDLSPGVGSVSQGFLFELLDDRHQRIGILNPILDQPPTVSLDTTRTTSFRTLSNMIIPRADLSGIDTLRNRVRVSLTLLDGSTFPLGVFMFGDDVRDVEASGLFDWTPAMFDESFLLDQPMERAVALRPGQSVLGLYKTLLDEVDLPSVSVEVPDAFAANAIAWRAGTNRLAIFKALAALLLCFDPYFDAQGTHTLTPAPDDPLAADVQHIYEPGPRSRIVRDTARIVDESWRTPNRYIVLGDNPRAPVSGVYDIPAFAPHSAANRGYVISEVDTMQGVASNAQARRMARTWALQDHRTYEKVTFTGTPDPRHGAFDIVQFLGNRYIEQGWDLVCVPGGDHRHRLSRIWGD